MSAINLNWIDDKISDSVILTDKKSNASVKAFAPLFNINFDRVRLTFEFEKL